MGQMAQTLNKNEEVVKTHMKERKEKQIEAPKALHQAKSEEVSIEAPSSSTLILKTPYEPKPLFQFMISFQMRNCLRIFRGIYVDMQTFGITFL
jgi:hypothetical protein